MKLVIIAALVTAIITQRWASQVKTLMKIRARLVLTTPFERERILRSLMRVDLYRTEVKPTYRKNRDGITTMTAVEGTVIVKQRHSRYK